MEIIKLILILIPLGVLAFLIHVFRKDNSSFSFKTMIKALLIYIPIVILVYFALINIGFIKDTLSDNTTVFFDKYIIFLTSCSLGTLITIPLSILIDKLEESKLVEKLESAYKQEEINYYRELLDDIPPAMLSMIYDSNSNINDMIVATIIYLREKRIIDENNKLIDNTVKLKKHETRLIQLIDNKNTYDIKNFNKEFKKLVMEDIEDSGYLLENKKERFLKTEFMEAISASLIIIQLILISALYNVTSLGVLTFISYFICFVPLPLYDTAIKKNFYRNKKAIEIKAKLEGLKKYLVDFTNVNDKSIKDIKLYDDYILYAIIFNLKGNIDEESKKIYDDLKIAKKQKVVFSVPSDKKKDFYTTLIIIIFFDIIIELAAIQILLSPDNIGIFALILQLWPILMTIGAIYPYLHKE